MPDFVAAEEITNLAYLLQYYFSNTSPTLSPTLTLIVSPSTNFPASNSCDNGLTRYFS